MSREMCYQCHRPRSSCFCSSIVSFSPEVTFHFLMHPKEARKNKTGTGRLTHLALKNSTLEIGEQFEDILPEAWVLYPGTNSTPIERLDKAPKHLYVIDGTWPCAKSMMKKSMALRALPRLSFSPRQSSFSIKQQPGEYCLSTLESVAACLEALEREKLIGSYPLDKLLGLQEKLVAFQKACAQDPTKSSYRQGSYKKPEERRKSQKWTKRCLYFDEKNYH